MNLYSVFIDVTKAFDTVNREAMWIIFRKLDCPLKFTTLTRLFHDDMTGEVFSDDEPSQKFNISNGVTQGCILALVLFNLFFTQVLLHAARDLDLGIYIKYHLDGSLFDLGSHAAKTKALERRVTAKRCLPTTVPSWPTRRTTHRQTSTGSRKHPSCSA